MAAGLTHGRRVSQSILARWRALAIVLAVGPSVGRADTRPALELGLGVAVLRTPDYPGSQDVRDYLLPLPYFTYRGPHLRVGQNSIRARWIHSNRLHVGLSLDGSLPVTSSDDSARAGMPNLRPTIGVGPLLAIRLIGPLNGPRTLHLDLSAHAIYRVQPIALRYTGVNGSILLDTNFRDLGKDGRYRIGAGIGPLWTSAGVSAYDYGVDPLYTTATRPAYQAPGGYAGTQIVMDTTYHGRDYWWGTFIRYQDLRGAAFIASPLVTTHHELTIGMGMAWILWREGQEAP